MRTPRITLALMGAMTATPVVAQAQHPQHHHAASPAPAVSSGWTFGVMGQVFPIVTAVDPFDPDAWLHDRAAYLTQPALMLDVGSPTGAWNARVTLDFEQLTQPDGEYTLGGWGEGFIDRRHPHTVLHELMVSWTAGGDDRSAVSFSAGKGFAPYGTEDPMGRPAVKYPTNHHLSQILERWMVAGAFLHPSGVSLEAGVFGGAEPHDAWDLSNIESFGDSWSTRLGWRFGGSVERPWTASASFARVMDQHGNEKETTRLANAFLQHRTGAVYGLVEASKSWHEDDAGYWSILAEGQLDAGIHQPYARVEWSTRPELHRLGAPGTDEYFRYLPGTHSDGATRWLITTVGYGVNGGTGPLSTRPFVELQHHRVSPTEGGVDPKTLYGRRSLWSVTTGFRIYLGGGPMRMGSYGAVDAMGGHAH